MISGVSSGRISITGMEMVLAPKSARIPANSSACSSALVMAIVRFSKGFFPMFYSVFSPARDRIPEPVDERTSSIAWSARRPISPGLPESVPERNLLISG